MAVENNKLKLTGLVRHLATGLFVVLVQLGPMSGQAAADLRPAELVDRFGTAFDGCLTALRTGDTSHLGAVLANPPVPTLGNIPWQWYSVGAENAVVAGLIEDLSQDSSFTHCSIRQVASPDTITRLALRRWANQMAASLEAQPDTQIAQDGSGQVYSWCENETQAIEVSFGDSLPGVPLNIWIVTGAAAASNPCREE